MWANPVEGGQPGGCVRSLSSSLPLEQDGPLDADTARGIHCSAAESSDRPDGEKEGKHVWSKLL